MKYVQFSNETHTAVVGVFAGPQDPEVWPNMGEVEDDDPRHIAYLDSFKASPAAEALRMRDELLRTAAIRIAPLQYAVDSGEATAMEEQKLHDWKNYSVELNRLPEQPGYPSTINWPLPPS